MSTRQTNGLELKSIGSFSKPIKEIRLGEIKEKLSVWFPENGLVTAYLDDRVLIGRWVNGDFAFYDSQLLEEKYLQKIRVFNVNQELYAWHTLRGFNARLRRDDFQGAGVDMVVVEQVLVGTFLKKKAGGFATISEQRGACLAIPFENITVDEKQNRVFIKTHNYIGYNPMGQATYVDCRFVAFTDGNKPLS